MVTRLGFDGISRNPPSNCKVKAGTAFKIHLIYALKLDFTVVMQVTLSFKTGLILVAAFFAFTLLKYVYFRGCVWRNFPSGIKNK